ncbi:YgiT-type zinc finger domain-containing protein [Ruminococcaceae bacterium CPB6]|jgi:YgiT-type zinc finger domain-containing protein|nr:YgiT-type zinc finger domain-containing protein [Ruminococcaceae bacterium CPB6]
MNCLICKGNLEHKLTTFMTDLDGCIVIIKNVPSLVCSQCGETYYDDDTMEQLEKISNSLRKVVTEVAIVDYPGRVA